MARLGISTTTLIHMPFNMLIFEQGLVAKPFEIQISCSKHKALCLKEILVPLNNLDIQTRLYRCLEIIQKPWEESLVHQEQIEFTRIIRMIGRLKIYERNVILGCHGFHVCA